MMSKLILFLVLAANGYATTFYIDYAGGSDRNVGTTPASAWQRHPYMAGWVGNYTHQAGDRFIFKGGVTWPGNCFEMDITTSGSNASPDYYGVDVSYYSGANWTKPIFDGGGTAITNGRCNLINIWMQSYITLDSLIMTNFAWTGTVPYLSYKAMLGCYGSSHLVIANCSFLGWSHNGAINDSDVVTGGSADSVLTNCVFDGSPNGTDSMMAMHGSFMVRDCTIRNMANGVVGNMALVTGCNIGPINRSFAGVHENGIEYVGSGGGTVVIASNIVHDCVAVTIYLGGAANTTSYALNNVIYNYASCGAIDIDGDSTGTVTNYIWNNTIVGVAYAIRVPAKGSRVGKLVAQNNHFIGSSSGTPISMEDPVTTHSLDYNLTNSLAAASTLGYTSVNLWRPTAVGSPSVDRGISVSSIFSADRMGVLRPQGSGWDIGAYEYSGGNANLPSRPSTPLNLAIMEVAH